MFQIDSSHLSQKYTTIENMLTSYFNQDGVSFSAGVINILDNSKVTLHKIAREIKDFIDDVDFSERDKSDFITKHTGLSFDAQKLEPLKWIKDLEDRINSHLSSQ